IAPLLRQVKGLPAVGLDPLPNQFCSWGIKHEQCRMFLTLPVADSTNLLRRTAAGWPKLLQTTFPNSRGEFFYVSNKAELIWGSLPFIAPTLRAEKNGNDEYLFAAVFALPSAHSPVPD